MTALFFLCLLVGVSIFTFLLVGIITLARGGDIEYSHDSSTCMLPCCKPYLY